MRAVSDKLRLAPWRCFATPLRGSINQIWKGRTHDYTRLAASIYAVRNGRQRGTGLAFPCGVRPGGGCPARLLPDDLQPLELHRHRVAIGHRVECPLPATDAMEMADREPHAKTCINLDARAYEFIAEKFPDVAARLGRYLTEGKVELIGGTYGQPMGTTIGGESNIRQIVVGRETIRKALGYEMVTFLEEEEFTHPQIPQIAVLAGFRYASLAQLDTWGRAGCPRRI